MSESDSLRLELQGRGKAYNQLLADKIMLDAEHAALRAQLADLLAAASRTVCNLETGLALWLKASLNCEQHVWEPDQRAAAQELVDEALGKDKAND